MSENYKKPVFDKLKELFFLKDKASPILFCDVSSSNNDASVYIVAKYDNKTINALAIHTVLHHSETATEKATNLYKLEKKLRIMYNVNKTIRL